MTTFAQLTDDLLTGVAEMDEQHRVLISLLNEVLELLEAGRREEARTKLVDGVVSYTEFHFGAEEAFLESVQYPECPAHKQIHAAFKQQVLGWVEEAKTGDDKAMREIVALFLAWLFRHIGVKDKAYGAFCRGCQDKGGS